MPLAQPSIFSSTVDVCVRMCCAMVALIRYQGKWEVWFSKKSISITEMYCTQHIYSLTPFCCRQRINTNRSVGTLRLSICLMISSAGHSFENVLCALRRHFSAMRCSICFWFVYYTPFYWLQFRRRGQSYAQIHYHKNRSAFYGETWPNRYYRRRTYSTLDLGRNEEKFIYSLDLVTNCVHMRSYIRLRHSIPLPLYLHVSRSSR